MDYNLVIEITGYANVTGGDSKVMTGKHHRFIEQIKTGAFKESLNCFEDVELLLNHKKHLGSIKEGNLFLKEDSIGLKVQCLIKDKEVINKALNNELRGWSFGFICYKQYWRKKGGTRRRYVERLKLNEVSLIDNTMKPIYSGTLEIKGRVKEEHRYFECKDIKGTTANPYERYEKILSYFK